MTRMVTFTDSVSVRCAWASILTGFALGPIGAAPPEHWSHKDEAQVDAMEQWIHTPRGFEGAGVAKWAAQENLSATAWVRLRIITEQDDQVTPARVNVVGSDGNYYQPEDNPLSMYSLIGDWPADGAWGNRRAAGPFRYTGRFFYTTGEVAVEVPVGRTTIEVWKGYDHTPRSVTVTLAPKESKVVDIRLPRAVDMAAAGYYAGDSHLHFPRRTPSEIEPVFDLMGAEDFHYGVLLGYNHPASKPYVPEMEGMEYPQLAGLGEASSVVRGDHHLISGQEYRTGSYGHINLYLRDELVPNPTGTDSNHWPVLGVIGRQTMDASGVAVTAHGGAARTIYADVAWGNTRAVELLQFAHYIGVGKEDWYHMLNAGFKVAATGASDYPPCRRLADCRTYVHSTDRPDIRQWLEGMAAGNSFITTGPLLLLEVNGEAPGAVLEGEPDYGAEVRLRLRSEVTPVTDLELILNGEVVEHIRLSAEQQQHAWVEINRRLTLSESGWIAVRAYSEVAPGFPDAEAHTNPIYVELGGRLPYNRNSIDEWVDCIDELITKHSKRTFPERVKVINYLQGARDRLLKIRAKGGMTKTDEIALRRVMPPGVRDLATDGSIEDATQEELAAFLKPIPPPEPEEVLHRLELLPGFEAKLMAAEPWVRDPIAGAFDADGNLFIGEMRDYPYDREGGRRKNTIKFVKEMEKTDFGVRRDDVGREDGWVEEKPKVLGTVRLLRDVDGDGDYDESHVFADDLLWPSGIVPWDGGIFVVAAPDILYLKDTDGDHIADVRRRIFTGFSTDNSQGLVNNLKFGPDHMIYGSTSGNGGIIRSLQNDSARDIELRKSDFRFDPRRLEFELATGTQQFGLTFDDWGNRFLCTQAGPCYHVVLPHRYLQRNPFFQPQYPIWRTSTRPTPIFRISPVEPWRHIRSSRHVAAGLRSATAPGASNHVFDAGAGVTVYRGGAFPAEYYGNVFVGDSLNNLVHRRVLVREGPTFRTERADRGTEFVRSPDNWFRPVNFLNAPDGTLYCLDMARETIEAINIPPEVEPFMDFTSGNDRGRIYRLAPSGYPVMSPPQFSRASTVELVAALKSPHGWRRDTAHRLIYERQDMTAVPLLEQLILTDEGPEAQVLALWSLQGLDRLRTEVIAHALATDHVGLLTNAMRLAESYFAENPNLRARVLELADHADAHVRLQAAFSIGEMEIPDKDEHLAALALANLTDGWMRSAVLSSAEDCGEALLAHILDTGDGADKASTLAMIRQLARMVGVRNDPAEVIRVGELWPLIDDERLRLEVVNTLGEGLSTHRRRLPDVIAWENLRPVSELARRLAVAPDAMKAMRLLSLEILGYLDPDETASTLLGVLSTSEDKEMRQVAFNALGRFAIVRIDQELLAVMPQLEAADKERVLARLIKRPDRINVLEDAVRAGAVRISDFTAAQRDTLLTHSDPVVRERATGWFGPSGDADRAVVYEQYLPSLALTGEARKGREIFMNRCSMCHEFKEEGTKFGPDLSTVMNNSAATLLMSIIEPNRDIPSGYTGYQVKTQTGEYYVGFIQQETDRSLVLQQPAGEAVTIALENIVSREPYSRSFMPTGLEAGLNVQDMSDLMAYLKKPQPVDRSKSPEGK